ncbi:hypothetical protein [Mesorhizobium sp. 8]|uniref:hypothetical protein n=1 Tax=Mesorhizobium sp. 8 TaxID=2584466 RepID=UPI001AEE759F|nr:hypothetical protein [Mesorhizobium sp. 8]
MLLVQALRQVTSRGRIVIRIARQMAVLFDPVKSQGENGLILVIQPVRDNDKSLQF